MKHFERLTLNKFSFGGEAVGRLADGKVCFVRGGVPGETVEVEIYSDKKNFCRGKISQILQKSTTRIEPECPYFDRCPGCSYLHVPYEVELAAKAEQFDDFINRGREENISLQKAFASPFRFNWRNRIKLHSDGGGLFGYRMEDNVSLLPVKECRLAVKEINDLLSTLHLPENFHGTFEVTGFENSKAVASFELEADKNFSASLAEFGSFLYPAGGFFQTNCAVGAELCRRVRDKITELDAEFLLELYCGVGVFSLVGAAAKLDLHSVGVESNRKAIKCAIQNAKARHLADRCTFFAGDAAFAPERFAGFLQGKHSVVLLDPPRSGLDKNMIQALLKMPETAIIYISCAPDTLRRDLDLLQKKYYIARSGMLDMFPGTAHFESLSLLLPVKEKQK